MHNTGGVPQWGWGRNHTPQQWQKKMQARGWTPDQITEAIQNGQPFEAVNLVNLGNNATRYVHPVTNRSVVIDDVTMEVIYIGGNGFVY